MPVQPLLAYLRVPVRGKPYNDTNLVESSYGRDTLASSLTSCVGVLYQLQETACKLYLSLHIEGICPQQMNVVPHLLKLRDIREVSLIEYKMRTKIAVQLTYRYRTMWKFNGSQQSFATAGACSLCLR